MILKKKSLNGKVLLATAGLCALVGSCFASPQFRKDAHSVIQYSKYNIEVPYQITVTKDMTNLDDYGKKHGLKDTKLKIWKRFVLGSNYYDIKLDPEKTGIDSNGKFYPGKKVNMIKP